MPGGEHGSTLQARHGEWHLGIVNGGRDALARILALVVIYSRNYVKWRREGAP